ncbi:hypothetical protein C8J57DRAFT_1357428, partial [Mycena rebaudengoi]
MSLLCVPFSIRSFFIFCAFSLFHPSLASFAPCPVVVVLPFLTLSFPLPSGVSSLSLYVRSIFLPVRFIRFFLFFIWFFCVSLFAFRWLRGAYFWPRGHYPHHVPSSSELVR